MKTFRVKGLKELEKNLLTLDNDIITKSARHAAKEAMGPVERRVRENVPVSEDERTQGALRDSIKLTGGSKARKGLPDRFAWAAVGLGRKGKRIAGQASAPGTYGLQVSYGTAKHGAAQPFLLLALKGFHYQVVADFREALQKKVEKGTKLMAKRAARKLKG